MSRMDMFAIGLSFLVCFSGGMIVAQIIIDNWRNMR